MAKVFKISAYIVDPVDEFDERELKDILEYGPHDIHFRHIKIDDADIGEWDDDLPVNRVNCGKEEFEKYFTREL